MVKPVKTDAIFSNIVRCPSCQGTLLFSRTYARCHRCHTRYAIKGGILYLYEPTRVSQEVKKQENHSNWYAHNEKQSYDEYEHTPFWKSVDADTFDRWIPMVSSKALVLDVGCAQGRSAFPFVRHGIRVIGYDISDKLIAIAQKRSAPYKRFVTSPYFFVGDASNFSFSDASFDVVVLHGVLHHLPNPSHVCKEIARVLKPDGLFLGLENNKTPVRWVFDLLQRLTPQWREEAGEEPLISEYMLARWFEGTGMSFSIQTRVFVPPHIINLLSSDIAHWILHTTDTACSRIPIVRSFGGLIEIIGKKNA